jgi:glutathione peroxidase
MKPAKALLPTLASLLLTTAGCDAGNRNEGQTPQIVPSTADQVTSGIIDHTVVSLTGETVDLGSFRGHPILIVNTASKCGYTPQYDSLQKLHEQYGERGLVVIGFPSNDFGNQEPGTAKEIGQFCRLNYGVTFPMMAKVHAKGPDQAPVYRALTAESDPAFRGEVRWNFTKFLIDAEGRVVARFEPSVDPLDEQVISAVEALLDPAARPGMPSSPASPYEHRPRSRGRDCSAFIGDTGRLSRCPVASTRGALPIARPSEDSIMCAQERTPR